MMKKVTIFVLAVIGLNLLAFIPLPILAMTGNGTEGDPYMIYNVTDLQSVSGSAYYELANDINASATETWNWDAGRGVYEGFVPISAFTGDFDGNYYKISNLCMNRSGESRVGLFGDATNSYVRNLTISDASIIADGNDYSVGVLAGYAGQGTFYRIITSGDVYGSGVTVRVGGIIGGCWVVGPYQVGLSQCASYANVEADSSSKGYAGGICGYGSITHFTNVYARGDVTAVGVSNAEAGGILARGGTNTELTNCYATGYLSGNLRGGLVAYYGNSVTASFWDTETTGCSSSSMGGTGKTTAEMKTESTFTDAGWDFTNIWAITPTFNDGYPHFLWYSPFPWEDYEVYQVLWFQPNDIIHGTTLPDRMGTEDGVITWGGIPSGISIIMGPLIPDYQMPEYVLPDDIVEPPLDMVGPSGQPRWTKDLSTLETHPFYPVVSMVSDQTSIPVSLVWTIGALLILLVAMLLSYRYAPHQIITALVGGGLSAFFYHMCIFPFWVIFIFAVMAVAIIIGERSPTVS